MNVYFLLLPILFPIISALIIRFIKVKKTVKDLLNLIVVVLTSIFTILLIFLVKETDKCFILKFNDDLQMYLKLDGLGKIFAFMVAILWPFAYLYATGYMKHEDKKKNYALFYVMTFAVVLGIAFSGNLITMYFFYELLTLVTLPLIIYPMTKEAKTAAVYYLCISLLGSALALAGIITILDRFNTGEFINVFDANTISVYQDEARYAYVAYMLMFLGFGVKAAVFPFHKWLPMAGVAPTPTTALLHAVAVVKAGAFAIIRVVYSVIGPELLSGSLVQIISMMFAAFTIVFGSAMAAKQLHVKRRFAYSTMSNISYILLAATMMNKAGLYAAILHLIIHSVAKIAIFFVAGDALETADVKYVDQLDGLGLKMKYSFASYTLAGLSLIGIPLFAGFISKFSIASAAIEVNTWYSIVGIISLLISALLTAVYVIDVVIRGYFKKPNDYNKENYEKAHNSTYKMLVPICVFGALSLLLGIFGSPLYELIQNVLLGGL